MRIVLGSRSAELGSPKAARVPFWDYTFTTLETGVGIGQGLPIHWADFIRFTVDVKGNARERGSIFLNARLLSLAVSLTVD